MLKASVPIFVCLITNIKYIIVRRPAMIKEMGD
jgi:hypothetical protein